MRAFKVISAAILSFLMWACVAAAQQAAPPIPTQLPKTVEKCEFLAKDCEKQATEAEKNGDGKRSKLLCECAQHARKKAEALAAADNEGISFAEKGYSQAAKFLTDPSIENASEEARAKHDDGYCSQCGQLMIKKISVRMKKVQPDQKGGESTVDSPSSSK